MIHHGNENRHVEGASWRTTVTAVVIPAKAGIHERTPQGKMAIDKWGTTARFVIPAKAGIQGGGKGCPK